MTDNTSGVSVEEQEQEEGSAGAMVGQKLQSVEEVYLYKIPPLKTAGGHRAEDWNLAKPLKTCSLLVEQHGDQLHLLFRHLQNPDDPNSMILFAQTKIDLSPTTKTSSTTTTQPTNPPKKLSMEYFVEDVVDSSRYFVVRIIDEKSGREARIGFGFRDREDATDFRESLNYYVKSMKRQEEAAEAASHFAADDQNNLAAKLSLNKGEKIHINIGNKGEFKKTTISKTPDNKDGSSSNSSGGGGGGGGTPMLLKKPPPAPKLNKDVSISFGGIDINADSSSGRKGQDISSTGALGEASSADDDDIIAGGDDDDDLWTDFEDAQDNSQQTDDKKE